MKAQDAYTSPMLPFRRDGNGVSTCHRGDCPSCGAKEALKRWTKVTLASAVHVAQGKALLFVSSAVQHVDIDDTGEVMTALKTIGTLLTDGEALSKRLRSRFGITARVRRIECT